MIRGEDKGEEEPGVFGSASVGRSMDGMQPSLPHLGPRKGKGGLACV